LDGRAAVVGRDERDQLIGVPPRRRDGAVDQATGGRHDRQAVGDAAVEQTLDRVRVRIGVGLRHAQRLTQAPGRSAADRAAVTAAQPSYTWLYTVSGGSSSM